MLKSEIEKLKLGNETIKYKINLFEQPELKIKYFECDQCDSSFISETSRHMYVNKKHKLQHFETETEGKFLCVMADNKCKRINTLTPSILI